MNAWPTKSVASLQQEGILLVEDGNHGESRPRPEEFVDQGVAFIRAADLDSGRVLFESASKITDSARARITKGIGAPGDILLSHKGTVGKIALVPSDAPSFVCSPQTTFWRTRDEKRLDRRYLHAFLRSPGFHEQLAARAGESDMAPYVSLTSQRGLTVVLAPIDEQRAIGNMLGTLDDKIDLNRRMNNTLDAMARAIFKSWFVDFEPVRAKAEGRPYPLAKEILDLFPDSFQDSPLGEIPKGWGIKAISDLARFVNGKNFTKNATGTGRMVIRIAELNSGPGPSTIYNEIDAEPDNTAFPNDLLFSWSGSLDVYRWHRDEALVNQHIFKVACGHFAAWFVYQQLKEAMPFFQGIASDKATTMGHIKRGHLSHAEFASPPDPLLELAGRTMKPMFDKVHANERESLSLAAARDALLPKLMSGAIDLARHDEVYQ